MCKQFHSFLADDGLLVMFFAHPKLKTWKTVFNAFIQAKFHVTATWTVTTESKGIANVKKKGSLLSSLIIVARKISSKKHSDSFNSSWENFEELFIEKNLILEPYEEKTVYSEVIQSKVRPTISKNVKFNPDYIIKNEIVSNFIIAENSFDMLEISAKKQFSKNSIKSFESKIS